MYKEIQGNTRKCKKIHRNIWKYHEIHRIYVQEKIGKCKESQVNTYREIQGNIRKCKEIPGNTRKYKEIPGNTRNARKFKEIQGSSVPRNTRKH